MSMLMETFRQELTGRERECLVPAPLIKVTEKITTPESTGRFQEMELSVGFSTHIFCFEKDRILAKEIFLKEVRHKLFGEFRDYLLQVDNALVEYDIIHARKLLIKIWDLIDYDR